MCPGIKGGYKMGDILPERRWRQDAGLFAILVVEWVTAVTCRTGRFSQDLSSEYTYSTDP